MELNADEVQAWTDRLLATVLAGLGRDLPDMVGAALTVVGSDGQLRVAASVGLGRHMAELQVRGVGGPIVDAATKEDPVVTPDVWRDERWPDLSPAAAFAAYADMELVNRLAAVRTVAAMPSAWGADGLMVLSAALPRPADEGVLRVLSRHEQLAACAVGVLESSTETVVRSEAALDMLQSRAAIEQAKGMVMALHHVGAGQAWDLLRRASNQLNVKIRHLAVALVEHASGSPAEQPDDPDRQIQPAGPDRQAAALLWKTLTETTHLPTEQPPSQAS